MKIADYKRLQKNKTGFSQVIEATNATKTDYPKDTTIQGLFEENAAMYPERVAVTWLNNAGQNVEVTYEEINKKAITIAHLLQDKGIGEEDIVGLLISDPEYIISSLIGVLKSGGAYAALDESFPVKRKQFILEDIQAKVIITEKKYYEELKLLQKDKTNSLEVIFVDEMISFEDEKYTVPHSFVSASEGGRSLAYVSYTSGTTGKPKGVLIEHRSVIRLIKNTNYIQITPEDRLVKTAPLSFDAATFEVWGALLNGASLHIINKDAMLDASKFGEQLIQQKITICWLTSSLFNRLTEQNPEIFKGLKKLLVGGAALSPVHINKILEMYPELDIINGYGPTENTTFSTTFLVNKTFDKSIPIGKPIANSQCYILNNQKQQVTPGVNGDLYVSGDGLARGYLNAPKLTAEKFIENPFRKGEKLYATGDIAKWMPDGNIRFIGRNDDQVKIRGFRIELGEIQGKLIEILGENNVLVTAGREETGELYLCAYIASVNEYQAATVKEQLQVHLPDYMIPAYVISLEAFPLNANGKIDTKALPNPKSYSYRSKEELTTPRNSMEESLLEIWKEVLELPQIGVNENFFAIGGHSLKATQVVSKIKKQLNFSVSIREVFDAPTIAALAVFLGKKEKETFIQIPKSEEKEFYPLSSAQKRLWVLDQFEEERLAYSMPGMFTVKGLNKDIFENALQSLVQRHESLRTIFLEINSEPVQKVLSASDLDFRLIYHELEGVKNQEAKIEALAKKDATKQFDLSKGPLFRVTLLHLEKGNHILIFNKHHIISDGWSMKVMVNEIFELYDAELNNRVPRLEPLRIQYKDYAVWNQKQLSGDSLENHKNYWAENMSKPLPVLAMPTDFIRPVYRTSNGGAEHQLLSKDFQKKIYDFSNAEGVSPFMTLLAITKVLLYRYTGQEDIIIGTPNAGREHEDLKNQIGLFVTTLPLRTKFKASEGFKKLLAKVRVATLDAYEHQVYPFDQIVKDLSLPRDMSRNPLYDVMVTFQNTGLENVLDRSDNELSVSSNDNIVTMSKVDLSFAFEETYNGLTMSLEYNTDLFSKSRITRMLVHFKKLANSILDEPTQPLTEFSYINQEEQSNLIKFGKSLHYQETNYGILHLLEGHSKNDPNKTAIICNKTSLSYRSYKNNLII